MHYLVETMIEKMLFSPELLDSDETADRFILRYQCKGIKPSLLHEIDIKSTIGKNDIIIFTLLENDELLSTYNSKCIDLNWDNFINECSQLSFSEDEELVLETEIRKSIINNTLHVYDYSCFSENLKSKNISQFLEIWNSRIDTMLTVIVHDESFEDWETSTISFQCIASPHIFQPLLNKEHRCSIREKHHRLVYSDWNFSEILPNDLYIKNRKSDDAIQRLFEVVCFYYTLSFLFDFCTISSDTIIFKLNGFKSKEYSIINGVIGNMTYDQKMVRTVFDIYNWIYSDGNYFDKITIARNIISINLSDSISIEFSDKTLTAIESNFRYFSKENAKNFISLRNEISKIILEQENKVASYVTEFISDFKKSILPSVTFFISIFAIRAISHQEIFDGFSPNIMKVSVLLVVLSIINLFYSWIFEFNEKLHFAEGQMKEIKNRYKPLLTDTELDEIFNEKDSTKHLNYFSFARKQRFYTISMWIICILLLVSLLLTIGIQS